MKIFIPLISILTIVVAAYLAATTPYEVNVQALLSKNHPARISYEKYSGDFDDQHYLYLIMVSSRDFSEGTGLFEINKHVYNELSMMPQIVDRGVLTEVGHLKKAGKRIEKVPFFQGGKLTSSGLKLLTGDIFWKNTYLSSDKKASLLTVEFKKNLGLMGELDFFTEILAKLKRIESRFPDIKIHLLGEKITLYYAQLESNRALTLLTPLLLFLMGVMLFFLFRSYKVILLSYGLMLLAFSITVIFIILREKGAEPFSMNSLYLILIIATSDIVHFFSRYAGTEGTDIKVRLEKVRRGILKPCFFTSITTALCFSSLMLSELEIVSNLGLYCSFGSIICFLLTFYAIPPVIRVYSIDLKLRQIPWEFFRISGPVLYHKKKIITCFAAVSVLFAIASTRLKFQDDVYRQFVSDHPLTKAVDSFMDYFNFVGSIDLVARGTPETFLSSEHELKQSRLHEELGKLSHVSHIHSFYNFQKHLRSVLPEKSDVSAHSFGKDPQMNAIFRMMRDYGVLDGRFSNDQKAMKLTVFMRTLAPDKLMETMSEIKKIIKMTVFDGSLDIGIEGFAVIRTIINDLTTKNFIQSFGMSLLMIFIIFIILFRSLKWGVIAMIPNIFPILAVSGMMGLLSVDANHNMVIAVCMVLGIAIDDTIHFLFALQKEIKNGGSFKDAVGKTYSKVAGALIGTTLIFVFSLPIYFFTSMIMFIKLALFIMTAMVVALFADLFLLPGILVPRSKDRV